MTVFTPAHSPPAYAALRRGSDFMVALKQSEDGRRGRNVPSVFGKTSGGIGRTVNRQNGNRSWLSPLPGERVRVRVSVTKNSTHPKGFAGDEAPSL